jgi:hypothetical protein
MPSLQEIRRMILHQSAHCPQFHSLKTAIGREAAWRQPKLALSIIPLSMNVWRFAGIASEEKEPVGTRPKHRRHRILPESPWT